MVEAGFVYANAHRDAQSVSPGWNQMWKRLPAASYTAVDYPDFDICRDVLARRFDIVIADQVLEHVPRPVKAVQHLREMVWAFAQRH